MATNGNHAIRATFVLETESIHCDLLQTEHKAQLRRIYITPREITSTEKAENIEGCIIVLSDGQQARLSPRLYQSLVNSGFMTHLRRTSTGPTCVLLTPAADGFVARSDFISYRLQGCPQVLRATSLLGVLTQVAKPGSSVVDMLESAAGVILLDDSVQLPSLELELEQRLNLPWLQHQPREKPFKLCIVVSPSTTAIGWQSRWNSAAALGVELVIISSQEWCNLNGSADCLRNLSLIPVDLGTDGNLASRLVSAVENQSIDGIFTCTDDYLVSVAQAAQALNLPTAGVKAYTISTDKFLTRTFSGRHDGNIFSIQTLAELDDKLAEDEMSKEPIVLYPTVCKPSTGRGSEGVFRADSPKELRDAVARILAMGRDCPSGVVIEPYVDGPELDVNLVMLDGRVLFSEVVDDFPSPADYTSAAAFNETQTHAPSGLPDDERAMAVNAMVEAVLLQGFRSGVFHCEARVRDSRMDYRDEPGVPFPVLDYKVAPAAAAAAAAASQSSRQPSIFLHEINARCPGIGSSTASLHSTGVDYFALQLLAAAGDWGRFSALATPFQHAPTNYVSLANVAVDVPATLLTQRVMLGKLDEGTRIAIPDDAFPNPQLRAKHAALMRHVVFHTAVVRPSHWYGGEVGCWRWFMTGVVVSSVGREEALNKVAEFAGAYQGLLCHAEGGK